MKGSNLSYPKRCFAPLFLRQGEDILFPFGHYWFYGGVREGRLADLSFNGKDKEGEVGVIDGLVHLLEGRDEPGVLALTSRELDHFLREENHISLLDHLSSFHFWFGLKDCFLELLRSEKVHRERMDFSSLCLLNKILRVNETLEALVRPFLQGESLELLDVGDQSVVMRYSGEETPLVMEFIEKKLGKEFIEPAINVILVE